MKQTNDGGPAFPGNVTPQCDPGMSLRDYFAAEALTGLLASNPDAMLGMCDLAYDFADAMLKAREG